MCFHWTQFRLLHVRSQSMGLRFIFLKIVHKILPFTMLAKKPHEPAKGAKNREWADRNKFSCFKNKQTTKSVEREIAQMTIGTKENSKLLPRYRSEPFYVKHLPLLFLFSTRLKCSKMFVHHYNTLKSISRFNFDSKWKMRWDGWGP